MRCLAIVHQRDAGPGVFAQAMAARGARVDEWHVAETADPPADPFGYDAVMTFGGSMHPDSDGDHAWMAPQKDLLRQLFEAGMPLLGACLGHQLLGAALGAAPGRASEPEIGWHPVEVTPEGLDDPLIGPLAPSFVAFQWHSYEIPLPPGAVALATSPVSLQAWRAGDAAWGIQFHAEVSAADADSWIDDYRSDPDAVRIGLDPDALRAETRPRMEAWDQLGREMCVRFLEAAAARAETVA
jgi:GMP synthase (glutamine-hydrolysing)